MAASSQDDDCDYEHSSLSGPFTRNGETIDVEIYRFAGTQDPWRLEVFHMSHGTTQWQERFATEEDAYRAFMDMAEADGIALFTGALPKARH